tara:strand:- start:1069 stop:1338 length:270 start_codon:yes stop_codon:yes gene_type:complete
MKEKRLLIKNKLGLHARAAAKIVTLTNKFTSNIEIKKGDKVADAKSIMKILMLAVSKGSEILITANGKDEVSAIHDLEKLIERNFDENE